MSLGAGVYMYMAILLHEKGGIHGKLCCEQPPPGTIILNCLVEYLPTNTYQSPY